MTALHNTYCYYIKRHAAPRFGPSGSSRVGRQQLLNLHIHVEDVRPSTVQGPDGTAAPSTTTIAAGATSNGSIVAAITYLGPASCALSIVEGNSNDGTTDVLSSLHSQLEMHGIRYLFQFSSIDPTQGDRIRNLADLRNLALEPLLKRRGELKPSSEAVVIFLNDVVPCPDDILEFVLQKRRLSATITCAMDWTYVGRDPTFYDVWVARSIHGDSLFEIPADGSWKSAWNLLWNADDEIRSRFRSNRPFLYFRVGTAQQVWGGRGVGTHGVRFRSSNIERGKVAVIPAVNLEYSVERGGQIKDAKGFKVTNVAGEGATTMAASRGGRLQRW
ncbi:hypothetical protein ACCO45_011116 [Purpureocillium lilacinum]|uniref:Uncharacterized protein n=1 Tax=Purpureocillium lilacinum TaxID=33203 RepID=A0ACC4DJP2_PURLI